MCLILLAEDDADDRLMIRRALSEIESDKHVREFVDGVELMEFLEDDDSEWRTHPQPAIVFLDLNMPRKSGRQALQEIKSHPELRTIPVVVLTTSSSKFDVAESYEAGVNAYLTKPHGYRKLVNTLRTAVDFWCNCARLPNG